MAGDWIKLEHATPDKPEIDSIANACGIDHDSAFGKCVRLWIWADQQSVDGDALSVTCAFIDRLVFCPGFAKAMRAVGWLDGRDGRLSIPNFDLHNGETAKKRAQTAKRNANLRDKRRSRDAPGVTKCDATASPREEKRRVQSNSLSLSRDPPIVPDVLEAVWQQWTGYVMERWGERIGAVEAEAMLKNLLDRGADKARMDVEFSIAKRAKSILDSSMDYQHAGRSAGTGPGRSGNRVPTFEEGLLR